MGVHAGRGGKAMPLLCGPTLATAVRIGVTRILQRIKQACKRVFFCFVLGGNLFSY